MPHAPRVLLLTATVTPAPGVGNLKVSLPSERRDQYLTVFRHALTQLGGAVDGIVLAENSDADLAPFAAATGARSNVELMTIPARAPEPGMGRGYLETALVHDAFKSSTLLAQPDAMAWKVTGRYQIRNLGTVVRRSPSGCDLVFNLRNRPQNWADMWIYGATARGMQLLEPHMDAFLETDATGAAETRLYDILLALQQQGAAVATRLPVEPRLSGVRGYDGASYDSPAQQAKWLARSVARRVAPRVWI